MTTIEEIIAELATDSDLDMTLESEDRRALLEYVRALEAVAEAVQTKQEWPAVFSALDALDALRAKAGAG